MCVGIYAQTLEGYYLTHPNERGVQAVVEIFQKDQKYFAYGFANTDGSASKDQNNPDEKLRGRDMNGVIFVWNLVKDKNEWSGGKIYNYANGKTYDASAWFDKNGDLVVKASVWGFGKKLIWKKITQEEAEKYFSTKPSLQTVLQTLPQ